MKIDQIHRKLLTSMFVWAPALCFGSMDTSFEACHAAMRAQVPQYPEVTPESFDRFTQGVQDLRPKIEQATSSQPEFELQIWDYLTRLLDPERVQLGQQMQQELADALMNIASKEGVDGATTVAVFGVESNFGRMKGRYPVVDATMSRACLRLSNAERQRHFFAALWLLQEGRVQPDAFKGSWAGAFGMTQFMPGTFKSLVHDAGDTTPLDIINKPADALTATARYLKSLGWKAELPWAVEVRLPNQDAQWVHDSASGAEHACLTAVKPDRKCRTVQAWANAGLLRVDGSALLGPASSALAGLSADTNSALLLPAGVVGPAWLITQNYRAIWGYNRADAYALAIGLLSDILRGAPGQQTAWPTDDLGLTRAQMRELQELLRARGACDVQADGFDGPLTRKAVMLEEKAQGWPETGRVGMRLLKALQVAPAPLPMANCP